MEKWRKRKLYPEHALSAHTWMLVLISTGTVNDIDIATFSTKANTKKNDRS